MFHIIVPAYKENEQTLNYCHQTLETLYPESNTTFIIDQPTQRMGKGHAIKQGIQQGTVNCYIDADLAVNPYNLKPMVEIAEQRHCLVVAERIATNRAILRTLTSKIYNGLTRLMFGTGVNDHQCGCKALSPEAAKIAASVKANGFFFDTELIVRCKRAGIEVVEFPVAWTEHKKRSTVNVAKDGGNMFLCLWKLWLLYRAGDLRRHVYSRRRHYS